jgi:hypothetical protein
MVILSPQPRDSGLEFEALLPRLSRPRRARLESPVAGASQCPQNVSPEAPGQLSGEVKENRIVFLVFSLKTYENL